MTTLRVPDPAPDRELRRSQDKVAGVPGIPFVPEASQVPAGQGSNTRRRVIRKRVSTAVDDASRQRAADISR